MNAKQTDQPQADDNVAGGPAASAKRPQYLFTQLRTIAIIGALITILSCFGATNWIADLFAQLRFQWTVCWAFVVLGFALTRRWVWLGVSLAGMLVCGYPMLPYVQAQVLIVGEENVVFSRPGLYRLMSLNVLTSNQNWQEVIDLIETEDPDFLVLMEVDQTWQQQLEILGETYAYSKFQSREDNFGIAFLSKYAWSNIELFRLGKNGVPSIDVHFSKLDMEREAEQLRLIATHPIPPLGERAWKSRNEQLFSVANRLNSRDFGTGQEGNDQAGNGKFSSSQTGEEGLDMSVSGPCTANIVVGDLNLAPWSPNFEKVLVLGGLRDSARGFLPRPTWYVFPTWLGGLKIDHALVGATINVYRHRVGPNVGSDHRAVVLDFAISSSPTASN
ncbi:MAG: endonuclease/exonuclease/phosphatase family protein [Mariniblastus sp.]